ncbi:hypothetical protein F5148DRAFT_1281346 [Russula earlei]|uniref:Uncharacterized protein n=1 Tax=Russula earlei TaxID=71964 RepID=A0ACC0UHD6_9AGAM|nr:hypothetical protein F5148DRAFT_1281346 [Russula earlei]
MSDSLFQRPAKSRGASGGDPCLRFLFAGEASLDELSCIATMFWPRPAPQSFFRALAYDNTSAPLIPKVFDAFCQEGYCFFVMKRLPRTCGIPEAEAVESVAPAVKISFEEEACVRHAFFKEDDQYLSPTPKRSLITSSRRLGAAQTARNCPPLFRTGSRPRSRRVSPSTIATSARTTVSSTPRPNVSGWLSSDTSACSPKVFQTYAFFNTGNAFAAAVGRELGYEPSDIANKMVKASAVLQMCGLNASLSLDKWGKPVSNKA